MKYLFVILFFSFSFFLSSIEIDLLNLVKKNLIIFKSDPGNNLLYNQKNINDTLAGLTQKMYNDLLKYKNLNKINIKKYQDFKIESFSNNNKKIVKYSFEISIEYEKNKTSNIRIIEYFISDISESFSILFINDEINSYNYKNFNYKKLSVDYVLGSNEALLKYDQLKNKYRASTHNGNAGSCKKLF